MTLTLRYMQLDDIPAVVMIDTVSFDPSWSARSYAFEITDSNYSYMLVLEQTRTPAAPQRQHHDAGKRARRLGRWLREMGASVSAASGSEAHEVREIVGYGGMWIIADEAHISTIASHPQHRGRGFGELALMTMIRKAIAMRAAYIVLEVRVSNVIAQQLYTKYGFQIVDTKQNYYHVQNEDGYDMRLSLHNNDDYVRQFLVRYDETMAREGMIDVYALENRAQR